MAYVVFSIKTININKIIILVSMIVLKEIYVVGEKWRGKKKYKHRIPEISRLSLFITVIHVQTPGSVRQL